MHSWLDALNMPVDKFPAFQISHTMRQIFRFPSGINVYVFLSTFQLTALLLKKIHLRLHRYTLPIPGRGVDIGVCVGKIDI